MNALIPAMLLLLLSAPGVAAQDEGDEAPAADAPVAVCFDPVAPVTALDIPSRYKDDSKNRSDFDEEANAAVEAALKPIDDFIVQLVKTANAALTAKPEDQAVLADCVLDRLAPWADADGLSGLTSQGGQLSAPSRIAGMAMAYAQVRGLATQDGRQARIESWFATRTRASMAFFDTEAPPRASQNNLRAWAALEAAQVGLLTGDAEIKAWAAGSVRLVACTANADGSLPNEMWRGKLALHYQIHAVGPLVVSAALLATDAPDLFTACDSAILRAARFAVSGAQDPAIVEPAAGAKQSFNPDPAKLKAYEFAWLVPLMRNADLPELAAFASQFKTLANSKLGGDQDLVWPAPQPATTLP
jgi:poly(beta-D-mannuronate) lyase